jgi:hypothetical protein
MLLLLASSPGSSDAPGPASSWAAAAGEGLLLLRRARCTERVDRAALRLEGGGAACGPSAAAAPASVAAAACCAFWKASMRVALTRW